MAKTYFQFPKLTMCHIAKKPDLHSTPLLYPLEQSGAAAATHQPTVGEVICKWGIVARSQSRGTPVTHRRNLRKWCAFDLLCCTVCVRMLTLYVCNPLPLGYVLIVPHGVGIGWVRLSTWCVVREELLLQEPGYLTRAKWLLSGVMVREEQPGDWIFPRDGRLMSSCGAKS